MPDRWASTIARSRCQTGLTESRGPSSRIPVPIYVQGWIDDPMIRELLEQETWGP
ncbi:MAG: hypothetical protein IH991_10470 [Planctomycetes bacterium]|nr:hypothetical protein [Planctomycetota bacterium]